MKEKMKVWVPVHAAALARCGRRALALVLCLALCLSMLPLGALAEDTEDRTRAAAQSSGAADLKTPEPETTVPETTVPETTVPETTVPETTVPETTVPETTVPETTVPETTVPETTVPETTFPETTVPETTVPETTVPETTVPETTVPETTVPETTVPEATEPDPTVESLKVLLEALPETVTADNAEAVAAQLEAIDEAKSALTEAQLEQLDFARYDAVLAAWMALVDGDDGVTTFGGWSADAVARVDINGQQEYYESFSDAYDRVKNCTASDNASITLINNPGINGTQYLESGVFTLDVYGEQLDTSDSHASRLSVKGATVTFQNTTTSKFENPIILQSGSLHIAGGQYGDIASVTVDGGTLRVTNIDSIYNLTVNGGEAALSKGNFYNLVVTNGTVRLSGGYYGSIQAPSDSSVAKLLETGYVYQDWKTDAILQSATLTGDSIERVYVIKCTHKIENGFCIYCGMACPHQHLSEDATCADCGKEIAASVTVGDAAIHYETLEAAIQAAQSSTAESLTTVKLLRDVKLTAWPEITGKFTLDLNGKTIDGGSNIVDVRISGGEMTLTGAGYVSVRDIYVYGNGSLIISDQCTAGIAPITVSDNGKLNSSGGSIAIVDVDSFKDGSAVLSGGSYGMIECSAEYNGEAVTIADLLAPGCGIQNKKYKDLENALKLDVVSGNSYTVVPCAAHDVGTDGRCTFCNTQFCAQIQTQYYGPYYFTTLQAALDASEATWPSSVVRLLKDAGDATISEAGITLDLNGYNLENLTVKIYFYLKNSGEDSTIRSIHFTDAYERENYIYTNNICKDGWWFKINGNWTEEKVTLENGTLTGIQVCKAPIQSLTIDKGTETTVHLGDSVSLTASVTTLSGATENVTYRWYQTYQWGDRETDLNEHKKTYTFTPSEEGEFYFNCEATCDGFKKSVRVTVTAERQDISKGTITLPVQPVYDGDWHEMNYKGIQWNGKTLTCNEDYKITWDSNMNAAADVEEKTVTISGMGNYKGERQVTWSLRKATTVPDTYVKSVESKIYYDKTHLDDDQVEVTLPELPKGGKVTEIVLGETYNLDGSPYEYTIFPSGQPGVADGKLYYFSTGARNPVYADITLTVESQNYEPYPITVRVSLVDKTTVNIEGTMENDKLEYSGAEQEPVAALTVTPEVELEKQYFRYSEQNGVYESIQGKPKNAGKYKVIYSVPQSNEIYEGSREFEFTVTPKNITVSNITAIGKEYDGNTSVGLFVGDAKFQGVYTGDEVSVTGTENAAEFESASAGVNKKVYIHVANLNLYGADAGNYALQAEGSQMETTATIDRKDITVRGLGVEKKTYDGTTDGTVDYSDVSFDGLIRGDSLTLEQNAVATFEDASAGTNKTVTVTSLTLSGAAAGNYRLVNTEFTTEANIDKRTITVSGIQACDKDYDGTTTATLRYDSVSFGNKISGDDLTVVADGHFETADAGVDKTVVITNPCLKGTAKENYDLQTSDTYTATATVRPRVVTLIGVTAKNKTYDGSTAAELELAAGNHIGNLVGSDGVDIDFSEYRAAFADKNVGTSKTVAIQGLKLTGDASGNYTLPQTFTLMADITKTAAPTAAPGSLTVANGYANSYTFDFSKLLPTLSDGKEFDTVSYGSPVVDLGDYYEGGAAVDENGSLTLPIVQKDVTTEADVGTVTVTVRSSNFEDFTLTLNVRSSNRKLPLGAPILSRDTLTYGEALSAITLSGSMYYVESDTARSGRVQVPGSFTWTAPGTRPNAGSCEAQWTFTPADPVTYLSVTGTSTIRVLKAEQEVPGTPELESREQTRITLKTIAQGPDGAKVQYRIDNGPWQDSPVFDGLIAGEEYAFQARYEETENYSASAESQTAKLTTKPYVLTFQVNGGSAIDSVEAKAGAVIRLNSYRPTRSGYRFEGWYSDESLKTKVTSVTMDGDTTVYARWTVRNSVIPATGDDAPIALSLTIFALSAVAFTSLVVLGRKRKEQ